MPGALHFSTLSSASAFESSLKQQLRKKKKTVKTQTFSGSSDEFDTAGGQVKHSVILVERLGNGTSKRYTIDSDLRETTVIELHKEFASEEVEGSHSAETELSWLPDTVKGFIFPAGFPGSVSDDYLDYMVLQFPTNVTGWICHALVTSSLLKAVGVGSFSGTAVAASAAAIRWVSKDGIGAVGRLLIGGRFANVFDDDPKQWRMYADFIGSAGSIFDLSTLLYPAYFLPLASLGNLTKAVARGLKDPSFRLIQNHFAISGNLGEVAAKEEVWEVAAQLIGLGLGILILDAPGLSLSYFTLPLIWITVRMLHLCLRYQSLTVLCFNSINLKRARILVKSHVQHSRVPGYVECNKRENILLWENFTRPCINLGVSLEEMLGGERSVFVVKRLIELYSKEKFILFVNKQKPTEVQFFVSFKIEATSISVFRSVWQAHWLQENWNDDVDLFDLIEQSLLELENRFLDFMEKLESAGWDMQQIVLKVPKKFTIEELHVG